MSNKKNNYTVSERIEYYQARMLDGSLSERQREHAYKRHKQLSEMQDWKSDMHREIDELRTRKVLHEMINTPEFEEIIFKILEKYEGNKKKGR